MSKTSILSSALLAVGLSISSPSDAKAQEAQGFKLTTPQGQSITVPCDKLGANNTLTAEFLGTLDTSIHGYDGINMFEMDEAERAPYVEEAVSRNKGFNESYLRHIFELPYKQYEKLESEKERMDFLQKKLDSHGMDRNKVLQIVDACQSFNHD